MPVALGYDVPVGFTGKTHGNMIKMRDRSPISRGAYGWDQALEDAKSRTGESSQPPYDAFKERKKGNDW